MAKELSEERAKMLDELAYKLSTHVTRRMADCGLSMQEGLTVLSMMVSNIIATASDVSSESEEQMIEYFCESLKL